MLLLRYSKTLKGSGVLFWFLFAGLFVTFCLQTPATSFAQTGAEPNVMYGITGRTGSNPASLLTLDLASGAGTPVGQSGLDNLEAMAINSRGEIFALGPDRNIYRIDAASGTVTLEVQTELFSIRAMAFAANDVLFAGRSGSLYKIDLGTGTTTRVGFNSSSNNSLAFDPTTGKLWGASARHVFQIDTTDASVSFVAALHQEANIEGLSFDTDGNLYAATTVDDISFLTAIDKVTGNGSTIGPIGIGPVVALALRPDTLRQAQLGVSATRLEFGAVPADRIRRVKKVRLRNIGDRDLMVSQISLSGEAFELQEPPTLPRTLAPGEQDSLLVSFAPSDSGMFSGAITISSDDVDSPSRQIHLKGSAIQLTTAAPEVCYAGTFSSSSTPASLLTIEPETGAATLVGSTGLNSLVALAVDTSGVLFGLSFDSGLYFIDAATGEATLAARTGFLVINSMAFDANNRLFANRDAQLYEIDPITGAARTIGSTGFLISSMAFDPTPARKNSRSQTSP